MPSWRILTADTVQSALRGLSLLNFASAQLVSFNEMLTCCFVTFLEKVVNMASYLWIGFKFRIYRMRVELLVVFPLSRSVWWKRNRVIQKLEGLRYGLLHYIALAKHNKRDSAVYYWQHFTTLYFVVMSVYLTQISNMCIGTKSGSNFALLTDN